jgi:hypothetical protein
MAKRSRLALVVLAFVPLMKQTASMRVKIVVAARFFVARRIISTMGMPVADAEIAAISGRQKSMMRIKAPPLLHRLAEIHSEELFGRLT